MMEATSRSRHGTRFLHGKHCWLSPVSHIALRRGGEERAQEDRGTQAPLSAPALGGFWRRLHLRGAGTPPALLERVVPPQLSPPGPGVPVSRSQTPWPPRVFLGCGVRLPGGAGETAPETPAGLLPQQHWGSWAARSCQPCCLRLCPPTKPFPQPGCPATREHHSLQTCVPTPKTGLRAEAPKCRKQKHNLLVVPTPPAQFPNAPAAQRALLSLHLTPESSGPGLPSPPRGVVIFLLPAPFPPPFPRLLLLAAEAQVLPQ